MKRSVGHAVIWLAINNPVTRIGEEFFAVQGTVPCLRVLDFLHVGAQQKAADNGAISTSVNQRHFLDELLRDTGFFAHLVFRVVREVESSALSPFRDSCWKKSKSLMASQTPPRSGRGVFLKRIPLETLGPQSEEPRSVPQALWIEVGCRHAQIIVSGKVSYEHGENPNAPL
ncbi:MAG: hypothetical protein WB679_17130 [Terracidiphilus sp.]